MVFNKHLPQSIRNGAFYNDPIEGQINLFAEIEQGKRLPEKGLKQLDHAFDLAKFQTNDPAAREGIDAARSRIRDVLGENDFVRHLAETGQDPAAETFDYKGATFPKAQGPVLMRKEHDFFADKSRFMAKAEIKKVKDQFETETSKNGKIPRPQVIFEKTRDILIESSGSRKNIQEGMKYFEQFKDKPWGNRPFGEKSFEQPRKIQNPNNFWGLDHGFMGKGQDIEVDINKLNFSRSEELGKRLLATPEGKKALDKFNETGQPVEVIIKRLEVPLTGFAQEAWLGKVGLEVRGLLKKGKGGKPQFSGFASQGKNAEVYSFPKGRREPFAEASTGIGRHLPITQYRTKIKGERSFTIDF